MALEAGDGADVAKERAFAASDIEKCRGSRDSRSEGVGKGPVHGVGVADVGESSSSLRRFARVARMFRPSILRLQEI